MRSHRKGNCLAAVISTTTDELSMIVAAAAVAAAAATPAAAAAPAARTPALIVEGAPYRRLPTVGGCHNLYYKPWFRRRGLCTISVCTGLPHALLRPLV